MATPFYGTILFEYEDAKGNLTGENRKLLTGFDSLKY